MRRISLVLIVLITLGTVSASAGQVRRERQERGALDRAIRVVKSVFRPKTHGDILIPPLPTPASPSRP